MKGCTEADAQLERLDREAFVDFLLGVLDMDPATRWTPRQVAHHPVTPCALPLPAALPELVVATFGITASVVTCMLTIL